MARIIKTLIQKRVSDIDMFQHVNNVSQQMYFDLGKADFYRQVLQDDVPVSYTHLTLPTKRIV